MSSPTDRPGPRFLTLPQVADELAVTQSQVYALVRSGDLVGIQIGGRNQWRVERAKLEQYIDRSYRRTADSLAEMPASCRTRRIEPLRLPTTRAAAHRRRRHRPQARAPTARPGFHGPTGHWSWRVC
jgi:excisionase family DNA binding protein